MGVKDYDGAVELIKASTTRLGTSSDAKTVSGVANSINCINCCVCIKICPT